MSLAPTAAATAARIFSRVAVKSGTLGFARRRSLSSVCRATTPVGCVAQCTSSSYSRGEGDSGSGRRRRRSGRKAGLLWPWGVLGLLALREEEGRNAKPRSDAAQVVAGDNSREYDSLLGGEEQNKKMKKLAESIASEKSGEVLDVRQLLSVHYSDFQKGNAFHETLNSDDSILCPYVVKERSDNGSIAAVVRMGPATVGHPGVVHGGVTALTFDTLMGWVLFLEGETKVVTAYLHVDYRNLLPAGTTVVVRAHVDRVEGKKMFLTGTLSSVSGDVLYAECESLFLTPKPKAKVELPSKESAHEVAARVVANRL